MIINYRQAVPMVSEFDKDTLLLLHGDLLYDASMYERSINNDGVSISTNQSKFGDSSLFFDGSSRLFIPDTINFGVDDFTIEWWEYCTSSTVGARFCSSYTGLYPSDLTTTCGGILIGYNGVHVSASDRLDFGDTWTVIPGLTMMSITTMEWVHWAFVRYGTTLSSYRNGVLFESTPIPGSIHYDTVHPMVIGDYRLYDTDPFVGYIDEFRISKVARWTSNFTPPTEPYER